MLKGVVDDAGPSHYRLKEAYGHNPKRTEQLLDTFPMASVLKKVGQGRFVWCFDPIAC